jgi:serine/threonine protein kinase
MKDIASAIEFIHLQRIAHQDVKASNILVDENITIAKLADFGVAECKGFETTWNQRHLASLVTLIQRCSRNTSIPSTRVSSKATSNIIPIH